MAEHDKQNIIEQKQTFPDLTIKKIYKNFMQWEMINFPVEH